MSDTTKKPDFLSTDVPIAGQEWIVLSFIDGKRLKNCKQDFSIMKFRGAFSTQEEANKHATYLQSIDPYCNIYVGQGFVWIPAEDDPDKAKEGKYSEPEMNNLMEKYLINQAKAKEMYERRKNEMVMDAINSNMKKKNKNKKHSIDELKSDPKKNEDNENNENDKEELTNNIVVDESKTVDNSKIVDDSKTLEDILQESKKTTATLDAEIARAKQLLGMDLDGFMKAKQSHDTMEDKLVAASEGKTNNK